MGTVGEVFRCWGVVLVLEMNGYFGTVDFSRLKLMSLRVRHFPREANGDGHVGSRHLILSNDVTHCFDGTLSVVGGGNIVAVQWRRMNKD